MPQKNPNMVSFFSHIVSILYERGLTCGAGCLSLVGLLYNLKAMFGIVGGKYEKLFHKQVFVTYVSNQPVGCSDLFSDL